jgi:hypothetical protein
MNVILVTGCLLTTLTFIGGQVVFPGFEKEPPATLHAAHEAVQAWLATQAKEDVIETTEWTSEPLFKNVPLTLNSFKAPKETTTLQPRAFIIAKGKASTHWKKYLPLKKWTVTQYLVNDEGFRFLVTLPETEHQTQLLVDVVYGVDSFHVMGVCWAFS